MNRRLGEKVEEKVLNYSDAISLVTDLRNGGASIQKLSIEPTGARNVHLPRSTFNDAFDKIEEFFSPYGRDVNSKPASVVHYETRDYNSCRLHMFKFSLTFSAPDEKIVQNKGALEIRVNKK